MLSDFGKHDNLKVAFFRILDFPFLVSFGFPNLENRALALLPAVLYVWGVSWWSMPFSGAEHGHRRVVRTQK